jgi:hypothetical protein
MCKGRRLLVTAISLPICIHGVVVVVTQPPGNIGAVHWNEGSKHCSAASQPPLQVNAYNAHTFVLRQNPCASFEANFLHLLIGTDKALLIDTGALKGPKAAPLLNTVLDLLPGQGNERLPLLVVHTHKHLDHRSGDSLFQAAPGVRLIQADLASVKSFFGFTLWPQGVASLDLVELRTSVLRQELGFPVLRRFPNIRTLAHRGQACILRERIANWAVSRGSASRRHLQWAYRAERNRKAVSIRLALSPKRTFSRTTPRRFGKHRRRREAFQRLVSTSAGFCPFRRQA